MTGAPGPVRPSRVAFGLTLVGLVVFPALAYLTVQRSRSIGSQIERHLLILDRVDRLVLDLEQAESSARAFAITRDGRLLATFRAAAQALPADVAALAEVVEPAQAGRVEALASLGDSHLQQLDGVVAAAQRGDSVKALVPRFEEGIALMGRIEQIVEALRGDYRLRLANLLAASGRAAARTNLTMTAGAILLVLTLLGAAISAQAEEMRRERLRRRTQELQDLVLGVVGHDLRSPLAAVTAGAELLLKRRTLNEEQIERISRQILRSSGRMAALTRDLLDYTRARFLGAIELALEPADGAEICRRIVDEQRIAQPQRGITLELAGEARGLWDPSRLEQLFSNLLSNAIQHGAPETEIRVVSRTEAGSWWVSVHNQGTITPELLPEIFEPFSGGSETGTQRGRHLGLGLFIVERIASAHGGEVTVDSGPDRGTTFTVRLPINPASA